jgi:hypothetical protein
VKRSLLAAAALLLAATSANALDLKVSGYWKAFLSGTKETPICGMSSSLGDGKGSLMIKYIHGQNHLTGHIIKPSWRFPADGVAVPLTIGVDRTPILSGPALGYRNPNGLQILEFYIKPENVSVDQFLLDFAKAARFWVRFDEGTEQPWVLDMTGSAEVASVFRNCTLRLIDDAKGATQPYGTPQATQPYGKRAAPTQPSAGKSQPTQPLPAPVKKPDRVKPADDGSI